eukprot:CAMPEP_0185779208 /NCGR_PEP_ID=MMETSP1174-20130828/95050_1 /TAXON_ID=35687 /ORGANISM="Dictyocha speculum, Strain CCMP1381" /LENGTH=779 /DNA_ID=CAMNT_0028468247 /DNA_START=118 /DNA_END=2457 /DNA_ORIENTATION=+
MTRHWAPGLCSSSKKLCVFSSSPTSLFSEPRPQQPLAEAASALLRNENGDNLVERPGVQIFSSYGLAALSTRAARLRETVTAKEILSDLTEAEFALTLLDSRAAAAAAADAVRIEQAENASGTNTSLPAPPDVDDSGVVSIDVDKLVAKLERHQMTLDDRLSFYGSSTDTRLRELEDGVALYAYLNVSEMVDLLERVAETRSVLCELHEGCNVGSDSERPCGDDVMEGGYAASDDDDSEGLELLEPLRKGTERAKKAQQRTRKLLMKARELRDDFMARTEALSPSPLPDIDEWGGVDGSSTGSLGIVNGSSTLPTKEGSIDKDNNVTMDSNLSGKRSEGLIWAVRIRLNYMSMSFKRWVRDWTQQNVTQTVEAQQLNESDTDNTSPWEVFIRDDGTVDVDAAIQTGREAVRFSEELWDRLNGRSDSSEEGQETTPVWSTERVLRESPAVQRRAEKLRSAQEALWEIRDMDLERSPSSDRSATVSSDARRLRRKMRRRECVAERRCRLAGVDLDMERICGVIALEIDQANSDTWTSSWRDNQRRILAEYGLLDSQVMVLLATLKAIDDAFKSEPMSSEANKVEDLTLQRIDEAELDVVATQVEELVMRFGLTASEPLKRPARIRKESEEGWKSLVAFGSVDGVPSIQLPTSQLVSKEAISILAKAQAGVEFYARGTALLGDDIRYGFMLCGKAIGGATLSPREARTLQRTAKDLVTVVPVTIILIIPLTPVGHVLIFSFIQRIAPGFFPSTFTERRQNLMKLYEAISDNDEDTPSRQRRR